MDTLRHGLEQRIESGELGWVYLRGRLSLEEMSEWSSPAIRYLQRYLNSRKWWVSGELTPLDSNGCPDETTYFIGLHIPESIKNLSFQQIYDLEDKRLVLAADHERLGRVIIEQIDELVDSNGQALSTRA